MSSDSSVEAVAMGSDESNDGMQNLLQASLPAPTPTPLSLHDTLLVQRRPAAQTAHFVALVPYPLYGGALSAVQA